MYRIVTGLALLMSISSSTGAQVNGERAVRYSFIVKAPSNEVWDAWTTEEGLRSFFSPTSKIELTLFGNFDIHQNPPVPGDAVASAPNKILAIDPGKMLVTTWDAPVEMPEIRKQRTVLIVSLTPIDSRSTMVSLVNTGFGRGGDWDRAYEYFAGAWTWVAAALKHRFEVGPIQWKAVPDLQKEMVAIGGRAAQSWLSRR